MIGGVEGAGWCSLALCNPQRGQRSGWEVKQCLEGLAVSWDCNRGQRVLCVCRSEKGCQEGRRRGNWRAGRGQTENTGVQRWRKEDGRMGVGNVLRIHLFFFFLPDIRSLRRKRPCFASPRRDSSYLQIHTDKKNTQAYIQSTSTSENTHAHGSWAT